MSTYIELDIFAKYIQESENVSIEHDRPLFFNND